MQMKPTIEIAGARVFLGDCRDVLKTLPDNSVDSIVTDPPYELGFMGKSWDSSGIAYDVTVWLECLRVLKPGGHVLAFGGSRTWHRLAVAIEDAGFEIRDNIAWIYGSGFPKSLDVSKAVDKRLGAEREVVGTERRQNSIFAVSGSGVLQPQYADGAEYPVTGGPATPEAQQWQGWGTALKPAFEPIVVGRKPLVGTVAENVLAWGVGGLNIDGSRIGSDSTVRNSSAGTNGDGWGMGKSESVNGSTRGRWPANVVLDEFTAGLLDEQSGVLKSGAHNGNRSNVGSGPDGEWVYKGGWKAINETLPSNSGGASRFFYQAKASKRDRNEGLEDLDGGVSGGKGNGLARVCETCGVSILKPCDCPERSFVNPAVKNFHPTVKPTQLMRYLIKLVTPEGGVVLDPFTGSGSTGKAALLDEYQFIGAELTEEYLPIIEGRLRWASEQTGDEDDTLF